METDKHTHTQKREQTQTHPEANSICRETSPRPGCFRVRQLPSPSSSSPLLSLLPPIMLCLLHLSAFSFRQEVLTGGVGQQMPSGSAVKSCQGVLLGSVVTFSILCWKGRPRTGYWWLRHILEYRCAERRVYWCLCLLGFLFIDLCLCLCLLMFMFIGIYIDWCLWLVMFMFTLLLIFFSLTCFTL